MSIDKQQVAQSFSRAANSYDHMAGLQRRVGHRLLARSGEDIYGRVLDLGCGTGYFTTEIVMMPGVQQVFSLDIAQGMLQVAQQQRDHEAIHWLCGDAEQLPLADESVNCIFSSLAFQWCENTELLVAELARVLRPGGLLMFATTGPDTLYELRQAWAAVDDYVHVNPFLPHYQLQRMFAPCFKEQGLYEEHIQLSYLNVRALMRELKGIGAHNLNPGRPDGLTGRRRLQALTQAYEMFRGKDGVLPASYQIFYGIYRKAARNNVAVLV